MDCIKENHENTIKSIKKWLVDKDKNQTFFCEEFNVSRSFVSAVFVGKKQIPEHWLEFSEDTRLTNILALHFIRKMDLKKAFYKSFLTNTTPVSTGRLDPHAPDERR